jgi:uncharacterized membrane protein YedE/YeeE
MSLATYLPQIVGGALIGLGAAVLILANGHIAGISGIYGRLLRGEVGVAAWRLAFLIGLLLPAIYLYSLHLPVHTASLPVLAAAGLLVGIGTGVGTGCTSGHGVCGIANLSKRSLLATLLFMLSAAVTVYAVRHALVGA